MARLIQHHTKKVTTCNDGLEGLRAFQAARPPFDLVFVDYNMPQLDGLGLVHAIRAHEQSTASTTPCTIICTI